MKQHYGKIKGTTIAEMYETLSKKNRGYIDKFVEWKKGSITDKRLMMIRNSLIKFGDLLELDFDKATRDEITIAWNVIYASKELSIKSKQDDYMHIKQCFKYWFGDDEEYPKVVRGMKRPHQKGTLRIPKQLPTEEDIEDIIKQCRNPRDKFWVAWTGLDSATRPCENRILKWGDLQKDKYGYFFKVKTAKDSGDTETRSIRVIYSEPYLFEWMKNYPGKREENEFVFCHLDNPNTPLGAMAIASIFRTLKGRIKFKGKFSAYILRHACLTRLSKNPNVAISILKKMAGHSKNSNVIGEYQHFGDEDILEMNLMASGKKDILKKDFELKHKPIKCPHCKTSNPYDVEVCGKCNFALSQERLISDEKLKLELEQHQQQIQSLLNHEAKTMKIQQWNSKITKLLIKSLSENRNADEILKELKDFTI